MIQIEFFGIPRQRAGTAVTMAQGATLREVLTDLAIRFPRLAEACLQEDRLKPGYIANLNGDRFIADPETPLSAGDALLILSADAGG